MRFQQRFDISFAVELRIDRRLPQDLRGVIVCRLQLRRVHRFLSDLQLQLPFPGLPVLYNTDPVDLRKLSVIDDLPAAPDVLAARLRVQDLLRRRHMQARIASLDLLISDGLRRAVQRLALDLRRFQLLSVRSETLFACQPVIVIKVQRFLVFIQRCRFFLAQALNSSALQRLDNDPGQFVLILFVQIQPGDVALDQLLQLVMALCVDRLSAFPDHILRQLAGCVFADVDAALHLFLDLLSQLCAVRFLTHLPRRSEYPFQRSLVLQHV